MIKLDIAYEKKMSLGFDLIIILRTFPTVFNLVFEAVLNKMKRREKQAEKIQAHVVHIDQYPEAKKYSCNVKGDRSFAVTE
jgi:uncharacterized membrane protein